MPQIKDILERGWDSRVSLDREAEAGRRSIRLQLSSPLYGWVHLDVRNASHCVRTLVRWEYFKET